MYTYKIFIINLYLSISLLHINELTFLCSALFDLLKRPIFLYPDRIFFFCINFEFLLQIF